MSTKPLLAARMMSISSRSKRGWCQWGGKYGPHCTILAVSDCIEHAITSYAALKRVEVKFGCATNRCDPWTQCWVHRFNVKAAHFGARVLKRRSPAEGGDVFQNQEMIISSFHLASNVCCQSHGTAVNSTIFHIGLKGQYSISAPISLVLMLSNTLERTPSMLLETFSRLLSGLYKSKMTFFHVPATGSWQTYWPLWEQVWSFRWSSKPLGEVSTVIAGLC